jgi:serine/threonine-protein kinase
MEELGQGGMGRVYRAHQPSVNRVVALKVLPAHLESDDMAVRRFRQEAETAANLDHENIVKVWEASVDQPPYYISMQYLEGGTLEDRLAREPLGIEEALAVVTQVCRALDYAHRKGVVHRDIKPANILFDEHERPVLTDFGIARASEQTRLTTDGTKFGTPDYMSPEQAKGKPVDWRSDLFSLAVVFYEMLANRPPFLNENSLVTMRQIIDEPLPPLTDWNPDVPPSIDLVLRKAMAKTPEERFQTGAEFVDDLRTAYQTGEAPEWVVLPDVAETAAVSPAVPETAGSAEPPASQRKKLFLVPILIGILILMVGATLFAVWSNRNNGSLERELPPEPGQSSATPRYTDSPPTEPVIPVSDLSDTITPPPVEILRPMPTVPSVIGKRKIEAEKLLKAKSLKLHIDETFDLSGEYEKGIVMSCTPKEGSPLTKGSVVMLKISLGKPTDGVKPAWVPALIGKNVSEAQRALQIAELRLGEKLSQASDKPEGEVINSSPTAGDPVLKGSRVNIIISSGPPPVQVPVLQRNTVTDAKAILTAKGLTFRGTSQETGYNENGIPEGCVVHSNPEAGESVAKGTPVTLILSNGPKNEQSIQVPELRNALLNDAINQLKRLGLNASAEKTSEEYSDSIAASHVISSIPEAESNVKPNTMIQLVVSKGPKVATTSPGRPIVQVPGVENLTASAARDKLEKMDLSVSPAERTEYNNTVDKGRVIRTEPGAGMNIRRDATVQLTVSLGPKPSDPPPPPARKWKCDFPGCKAQPFDNEQDMKRHKIEEHS